MLQAAHQPAADTGNLGGIQRQILFLRHLDGHRNELRQMGMAAQFPAADSNSSQNFGFIPHADLPQLDSGLEHAGQVLDQLPEIDSAVRRKIEQHFVVIEGIFRVDQLHFQLMLLNFLLTDGKGLLFLHLIRRFLLVVPLIGDSKHRLQGLYHL